MSWTQIAQTTELVEGQIIAKPLPSGKIIALTRVQGRCFAFDDECTHEEVSLSVGWINGTSIECPAHGARFDLCSGKALCLPATRDLAVYAVKEEEGSVYVDLGAE